MTKSTHVKVHGLWGFRSQTHLTYSIYLELYNVLWNDIIRIKAYVALELPIFIKDSLTLSMLASAFDWRQKMSDEMAMCDARGYFGCNFSYRVERVDEFFLSFFLQLQVVLPAHDHLLLAKQLRFRF